MRNRKSSAENFESLSDVELHQKLLQHGLPNVPVTETTRNILINRLKSHIKKENYKRKFIDDTPKQSPAEYSRQENNYIPPYYMVDNTPSVYHTQAPHLQGTSTAYSNYENHNYNTSQQRSSPKMYAPPPILASDSCEDFRKTSFFNINTERPTNFNNSPPKYNQMHSMQMGMVGRLLSFRESTLRKKPTTIQNSLMNNDAQRLAYRTMKTVRETTPSSLKQFFSRFTFQRGAQQSIISQVLVFAFFIFFIAIALIYATMGSDYSNAIREKNTLSVVCDGNNGTHLPQDCIEKDNLAKTLLLNKELLNMLQERIKHYYCVNKSRPAALSISEFISSRDENAIEDNNRPINSILLDMEYLISNNPQWKIGITDKNGQPVTLNGQPQLAAQETFFMLLKPNLPMFCVFISKVTQFFTIIGTAALFGGLVALCYGIFCYIKQQRKLRNELIDRFASEIINELVETSKRGYEEEIVLINLRDKLLPLSNRSSLLKAWNSTLKLLESNESRIQFGLKLKNGEEVRTIKWIGGTPDAQNDVTKTKQWQSPAFDNRNQIINPPTNCLKIRHMFDCTEINNPNLSQLIYNAIVEKVGPKCKICDIQLDKQTCCVYVRCATEKDAGTIHNEINGWWFDKRLVSIKFLRLERYLSRFPKSRVSLNS